VSLLKEKINMTLPVLKQLLEYKNPAVLKLYQQNYPDNKIPAEQAFEEVLKYLWLSKKHEIDSLENQHNEDFPREYFMARSMQEIDEMWHEFILFTKDYTHFCMTYFGEYMHHLPNIFDNVPIPRDTAEKAVEKLLPYIYDHLGENTLRIWFASYLDNINDSLSE
jgi:hypothetical protein